MSDHSKIEWTDATWSPVIGCTKVSQGCKHCYAEREVETRWSKNPKSIWFGRSFGDVLCRPEALDEPMHWKKPRRIFVCPRADLFHDDVPVDFIKQVFAVMAQCPQHTFQVLTKRAARMQFVLWSELDWKPLPNVWIGVSVEDQASADERIPLLLETPAVVRWVSAEPLLGPVRLSCLFGLVTDDEDVRIDALAGTFVISRYQETPTPLGSRIDWVVVGGESGHRARPIHPDWARSLRDQCTAAGVPFLFKQWGEWFPSAGLPKETLLPLEKWGYISENGGEVDGMHCRPFKDEFANHELMARIGRTKAGRLLDGVLHDGYPGATP